MASQALPDNRFLTKVFQWGLLLSVGTYGVHVSLFILCIRPLLRRKSKAYLSYIVTLFVLATVAIALQIWWTQVAFIDHHLYQGGPDKYLQDNVHSPQSITVTAVYVLLNWLADGLLLYRFNVLWTLQKRINPLWRCERSTIIPLLVSSCFFVSLIVVGIVFMRQIGVLGLNNWTNISTIPGIAYLVLSLSLNILFTLLIVYRLLRLRSTTKTNLGESYARKYTNLVSIFVESASLYTVVCLITVIACGLSSPYQYALLPMLGQLQAIPPLMIILWTSERRAMSYEDCDLDLGHLARRLDLESRVSYKGEQESYHSIDLKTKSAPVSWHSNIRCASEAYRDWQSKSGEKYSRYDDVLNINKDLSHESRISWELPRHPTQIYLTTTKFDACI